MLILNKSDIKSVFPMKDAIESSMAALSAYSAGNAIVPLRTVIDIKDQGQSLYMPAYANSMHASGVKIVSVYPKNAELGKPSILGKMLVLDANTGEVCAMLDGAYLTQLRTGALQGAATTLLSRADAKIAVLFGTGAQAATQLEAMLTVRDLSEVRILDINLERAQAFVKLMQNELPQDNIKFVAMDDSVAAIKEADIITTVTTSTKPVFDGLQVQQGTHVNGIGAYLPHMQELPEDIIKRADKIYFDTDEGVLSEAGDILIPLNSGVVTHEDFDGELGNVILGKSKGRESNSEITVFKAVGSAILDVVTAQHIYLRALKMNVGQRIEM